jgi:predicted amidohydrolase YtcJ
MRARALAIFALALSCGPLRDPVDVRTVYHGGRIYTVCALRPWAQALAVGRDGRIAAVGSDEEILRLEPAARRVDLRGRFVMPGFIDAHAHLYADALRRPKAIAGAVKQAVLDTMAEYARLGITSVHEPGNADLTSDGIAHLPLLRQIRQEGRLTVRILMMRHPPLPPGARPEGDEWIRVGAVKLRLDFDMAARRALLLEPYTDDPAARGVQHTSLEELARQMSEAHDAGFQVAVHAIGDKANRLALDAIEKCVPAEGRPRIEHAQLVDPADWERFGRLGVIASMQPVHCVQDMRWAARRLGEKRLRGAFAWNSLKRAGAKLAFGSDSPVESPDPIWGIHAAVTRQTRNGHPPGGWLPLERVTVEEAIHSYTLGAAHAGFEESVKGSLEPGKLADFVVLSGDLTAVEPSEILGTQVVLTVVGGTEVYSKR